MEKPVYVGPFGKLALHYRLWQSSNNMRKEKLAYRVARKLPQTVKLMVLANACGDACNALYGHGVLEPDKVTYPQMYKVTEGKDITT